MKSRKLDSSSHTGDSPYQQFSGRTHSILMEDIVMGKILVPVTLREPAAQSHLHVYLPSVYRFGEESVNAFGLF